MKKKLASILDSFYCELGVGYTMYFTDEEVDVLVEHLIKNGVGIINDAIEEYRKLLDDNTEFHSDSLGIESRYVCIEDVNAFAEKLKEAHK